MKICVDTMVFIDILKDEYREDQEKFYNALKTRETLVIPTVVFAELMPLFKGETDLIRQFLDQHHVRVEPLDIRSTTIAGERWLRYLKKKTKSACPSCRNPLEQRQHVLSDFYIGGFAMAHCDAVLTRDRGIYRRYFPELKYI